LLYILYVYVLLFSLSRSFVCRRKLTGKTIHVHTRYVAINIYICACTYLYIYIYYVYMYLYKSYILYGYDELVRAGAVRYSFSRILIVDTRLRYLISLLIFFFRTGPRGSPDVRTVHTSNMYKTRYAYIYTYYYI